MKEVAVGTKVDSRSKIVKRGSNTKNALVSSPCFFAQCCSPIPPDEIECFLGLPLKPQSFGFINCGTVIMDAPRLVSADCEEESERPEERFSQ